MKRIDLHQVSSQKKNKLKFAADYLRYFYAGGQPAAPTTFYVCRKANKAYISVFSPLGIETCDLCGE